MARVLIVERAGRAQGVARALAEADFAVRTVDDDPLIPGHVFAQLDAVGVVAWLMGAGDGLHPEVNREQLETVLTKVIDTGVRGFVFERPVGSGANEWIDHARATWHIPIVEIEADPDGGEPWLQSVVSAVHEALGI